MYLEHTTEVNRNLQGRLAYLRSHGADLRFLGQSEQLLHQRNKTFGIHKSEVPWKVTGLETGLLPTDWKIWLAPNGWEYEWAGHFWHRIQNPELYIPGEFVGKDF